MCVCNSIRAHFHKVNSQGLLSWALALTPGKTVSRLYSHTFRFRYFINNYSSYYYYYYSLDGRLVGNGGRGPEAHWLLVAAQPAPIQNTPVAPTNAVQGQAKVAPGTTVGTVVSINNIDLEENNIIDLLSIGVHVSIPQQLQWLASPIGQLYLETCDPQIIQLYKGKNNIL